MRKRNAGRAKPRQKRKGSRQAQRTGGILMDNSNPLRGSFFGGFNKKDVAAYQAFFDKYYRKPE